MSDESEIEFLQSLSPPITSLLSLFSVSLSPLLQRNHKVDHKLEQEDFGGNLLIRESSFEFLNTELYWNDKKIHEQTRVRRSVAGSSCSCSELELKSNVQVAVCL